MICLRVVVGCADCESDPRAVAPHVCDDWCATDGESKRRSPEYHQRRHQPHLCDHCGAVLDDRRGNNYETRRLCPYQTCTILYCPGCRRETYSVGVVGCPACNGPAGHGTYGELRRPGVGRFVKPSKRRRHR
ncbi:hypothetical protein ABZ671_01630 [Micromonospora sp. NPDC006766]|uniref:hypothetical protein n=1 Tax=Micromonospora sp. NPDC006766 TaxID=3154778 RepID=UPI0033E98390